MGVNRCSNCGSTNLRADRALAGRIVCNDCGIPFGNSSYRARNIPGKIGKKNRTLNLLLLFLFCFFILIIIL